MDSSHILKSSSQISQKDQYNTFHYARKYPSKSSRRTSSFSSSSSLSSSSSSLYNPSELECSPLSPATPLRFSGVPFSWEHFPGIPKKKTQQHQSSSTSTKLLPLPPTTIKRNMISSNTNSKQQLSERCHDPFFAALVECSKDDDDNNDDREVSENANLWSIASSTAKVSRSLSDRFGFINLYEMSCKRTCAVVESIRHLPKSTRSSNYDLIKHRSR